MGFHQEELGARTWVGPPDLPADPDGWAFRATLACEFSRLAALDPVDEFGRPTPNASALLAGELVDHWWELLESNEELDATWLKSITEALTPLVQTSNPVASLLSIGYYLLTGRGSVQKAWEESVRELRSGFKTPDALSNWRSARYPGPLRQTSGATASLLTQEFLKVQAMLPSSRLLNASIDNDVALAQRSDASAHLITLRSDAERSGRLLQQAFDAEAELEFPGPNASLDEVLAVLTTID